MFISVSDRLILTWVSHLLRHLTASSTLPVIRRRLHDSIGNSLFPCRSLSQIPFWPFSYSDRMVLTALHYEICHRLYVSLTHIHQLLIELPAKVALALEPRHRS
jgi:hypothetical protein